MKPVIAHVRNPYLSLCETFIYEYILKISAFRPIVVTRRILNLDLFPLQCVFSPDNLSKFSWRGFWDRVARQLFQKELYFVRTLKSERACLVHAHFGPDGVWALLTSRKLSLPLITSFYGYDASKLGREDEWEAAYADLFRDGDLFLVEGSAMKKRLIDLGCPESKLRILHIGVDVEKFRIQKNLGLNNGQKTVLFCGRFVEKKGLIYALEAIHFVAQEIPDARLRVIGDGELKPHAEKFIRVNKLTKNVDMLGYQPHSVFIQELSQATVLVQPSVTASDGDTEGGAPTVLLEAQAAGVPVVATAHADIPEVMVKGETGFLVPERNSQALAERINVLLKDPELCKSMGQAGREHVERNYNIYKEVQKLENLYKEVLENRTPNQRFR